jgi:anti-sigma28 factor (negative regulator of flagellin synthesis)
MELRNNGLSAGVNQIATEPKTVHSYARLAMADSGGETTDSDTDLNTDWVTLSTAGSQAAQTASEAGVREDKVATVRAALAAGTYAIPSAFVAAGAISAMLGQGA